MFALHWAVPNSILVWQSTELSKHWALLGVTITKQIINRYSKCTHTTWQRSNAAVLWGGAGKPRKLTSQRAPRIWDGETVQEPRLPDSRSVPTFCSKLHLPTWHPYSILQSHLYFLGTSTDHSSISKSSQQDSVCWAVSGGQAALAFEGAIDLVAGSEFSSQFHACLYSYPLGPHQCSPPSAPI